MSIPHLPFSIFHFASTCSVYGASDHLIKELIPDVQVIHRGDDVDKRNYRVSFARTCAERSRSIRKHLGFIPRRTVAEGITSTGLS